MPEVSSWLAYALISLGMVLTPGPNMIYLISRSICQGRTALADRTGDEVNHVRPGREHHAERDQRIGKPAGHFRHCLAP